MIWAAPAMRPAWYASERLRRLTCFAFLGQPRLRRIVTLAIDRRNLRAHGPQIHRQLSAMVNAVILSNLKKGRRGKLEHAAEVHHPGQLFAAEPFEFL